MNSQILIIAGLLAVFLNVCDAVGSNQGYKKLNKFLARKGEHDGAGYLELVRQKLSELDEGYPFKTILCPFAKDLRRVVQLNEIFEQPKCTYEEFQTLWLIATEAGGHEYIENPETSGLSPVASIVHTVSLKRAQECEEEHLKNFGKAYADLDEITKERAEFMKDHLKQPSFMSNQEYIKYINEYIPFEGAERDLTVHVGSRALIKAAIEMPAEDPSKCDFDQLYEKILLEPCLKYDQVLGKPILLQAHYDSLMLHDRTYSDALVPFYQALANYRVCKNLDDDYKKQARYKWQKEMKRQCTSS